MASTQVIQGGAQAKDLFALARTQDKLAVIIGDRLSDLIAKGEVVPRYYNPGNLFREVHFFLTNDDAPDLVSLQPMVGDARIFVHNIRPPDRLFYKTAGWMPVFLRRWSDQIVELVRSIQPSLVRTHNNFLEGYLAAEIKRHLGIPYVTSLHGVWDRDSTQPSLIRERVVRLFRRRLERTTLTNADATIAVYKPVLRYAQRYGSSRAHLIYNAVSSRIIPKSDYTLASPPHLITVNRQVSEKNPENIVRAIAGIDCRYTLIGDGPLHERLREVAVEAGVADRVSFIKALPNEQVCKLLPECDLMVSHCDYWGISKGLIEAALAGLPTILNHHPAEPIPDCEGGWLHLCDNTVDAYRAAIARFLDDAAARGGLGRRASAHAQAHFDPKGMELSTVALYSYVLKTADRHR